MSSQEAIHDLIAQIGPILDLAQVTVFPEDSCWRAVFDAATWIDVEYEAAGDRLVLTGTVGPVEESARQRSYEALLRYTYIWTEHGGVRAALDGTPGNVVLMVELPAAGVDLPRLCQVLQNFRGVVGGWRELLVTIGSGSAPARFDALATTMLKV